MIASGAPAAFFSEMTILVVAAAVIAYAAFRLGLLPIVGFLLAGVAIGPNALGLVHDPELVEAAAEIGVILLLFAIGIEFSLERLAAITKLIFVGGGLQVGLTTAGVAGLLLAWGVEPRAAIFTGMLVALSSTAIVLKLLADRGETNAPQGEVALGLLIFQDLAIIVMVLSVPILAGTAGGPGDIAWALGKAGVLIAVVLLFARRLMPPLLEVVARTCSPEIFLLTIAAICFGTAWVTSQAGVSLSLGAFLAGLLVSESPFSEHALGEILPLKVLFSAAFFVSCGMLLDLGFVATNLPWVLGAIVVIAVVKALLAAASALLLGYRLPVAVEAGLMLSQVGEFSFVLERAGREVGLSPAGLGPDGSQGFVAATVLLMVVTPQLTALGAWLGDRWAARTPPEVTDVVEVPKQGHDALADHIIVAGYGETAMRLAEVLDEHDVRYVIVTLNPQNARQAEDNGRKVLRGDYTRVHTLEAVGIAHARMVVIADDQLEMAARATHMARGLAPGAQIVVRTRYTADRDTLEAAGASVVIAEDAESVVGMARAVLETCQVSEADRETTLDVLRGVSLTRSHHRLPAGKVPVDTKSLVRLQPSDPCDHAANLAPIRPRAQGCEACLAKGQTWVHLRMCMTCGRVGCCDTSKGKHARAHFEQTGHPIITSVEPGESWGWCYPDDRYI